MPIVRAVTSVVSKPTAVPADDVRRRTGLGRLGDLPDRTPAAGRVVLSDVDEGDAGREADDAGEEEPDPCRQAERCRQSHPLVFIITLVTMAKPDHGQQGRDPVTAVEHVHRVLGPPCRGRRRWPRSWPAGRRRGRRAGRRSRPRGSASRPRLRSRTPRRRGSSRRCSRRRWTRTGRRHGRRSRPRCHRRGRRRRPRCADRLRECPASTLPTRSEPTSAALV